MTDKTHNNTTARRAIRTPVSRQISPRSTEPVAPARVAGHATAVPSTTSAVAPAAFAAQRLRIAVPDGASPFCLLVGKVKLTQFKLLVNRDSAVVNTAATPSRWWPATLAPTLPTSAAPSRLPHSSRITRASTVTISRLAKRSAAIRARYLLADQIVADARKASRNQLRDPVFLVWGSTRLEYKISNFRLAPSR